MFNTILEDIRAVRRNDPSAHSWAEVVLCHAPLHAIMQRDHARMFLLQPLRRFRKRVA